MSITERPTGKTSSAFRVPRTGGAVVHDKRHVQRLTTAKGFSIFFDNTLSVSGKVTPSKQPTFNCKTFV